MPPVQAVTFAEKIKSGKPDIDCYKVVKDAPMEEETGAEPIPAAKASNPFLKSSSNGKSSAGRVTGGSVFEDLKPSEKDSGTRVSAEEAPAKRKNPFVKSGLPKEVKQRKLK